LHSYAVDISATLSRKKAGNKNIFIQNEEKNGRALEGRLPPAFAGSIGA